MKIINNRYHCTGQSLFLGENRIVIEDQDYFNTKIYTFLYKGIKKICRDNAIFYVFNTICAYEGNKNIHFPYRNSLTISIIPTGEKIYYGFDEHIARNVIVEGYIKSEEKKVTTVEIIFSEWTNDIEPIKDWLDAHSEKTICGYLF
jgi:hypothetical protein